VTEEIGLFEAMYTQKAIRRLKTDPIPDDVVEKLIEAATKAPSGGDRQPWSFIVVRDAEAKRKIGEWYLEAWNATYGQIPAPTREAMSTRMKRVIGSAEHLAFHLAEAPVFVIVCAQAPPDLGGITGASHYGSIFPAVQNLLLAARGLNVGATLTTLHKMHEADVKALLGIPDNFETVALVPLGYPVGKYGPARRRPAQEVTHWERWGEQKS